MSKHLATFLLLAVTAIETIAFVIPTVHSSGVLNNNGILPSPSKPSTYLTLSSSPINNSGKDGFLKARTDIRYFLTQRSLQSFVFLLNQCREEHSVRWLEKTLDFTSIDNFHGTGAFNQTKFPEWDSVFLDCVDRPEEIMVIQMRSRRRQNRLSGYNAYFESLKQPQTGTDQKPVGSDSDSEKSSATEGVEETKGKSKGFSVGNYLDSMTAPMSTPPSQEAKKSWRPSKKTSRRLSDASSYLEALSSSPPAPSSKDDTTECFRKDSEKKSAKDEPIRRAYGPGKSTSYLEKLSSAAKSPTSPISSDDEKNEKTEQSTETSKNPYLEETITEYELCVDPPAMVRRILSVREQISKEWAEDLDQLARLNDEIVEYLEEHNRAVAKEDEEEDDDEDEPEETNEGQAEKDQENIANDEDSSDMDQLLKTLLASANKETVPDVTSAQSKSDMNEKIDKDEAECKTAFGRNILTAWTQHLWSPNRSSSPFRKANFDLLLLLATQESIHRVLKSYKEDEDVRPETHEWLLEYYKDNVNDYFDGHQSYFRSEDFLEEMIKLPRTLIETNNEFIAWVDPAIVVEDIVRERSEVTLDWMRIAETISEEHTDLRRMLFSNMVSKPDPDETLADVIVTAVDISNITASESSSEVFGAFE